MTRMVSTPQQPLLDDVMAIDPWFASSLACQMAKVGMDADCVKQGSGRLKHITNGNAIPPSAEESRTWPCGQCFSTMRGSF
jgi:hypothetical protein